MKNRIIPYESQNSNIVTKLFNPNLPTTQKTYHLAELDSFRDKLRAGLFNQAMANSAALSAAEEHFAKIAPGGKDEYRLIVSAYAHKAVYEIIRGDW